MADLKIKALQKRKTQDDDALRKDQIKKLVEVIKKPTNSTALPMKLSFEADRDKLMHLLNSTQNEKTEAVMVFEKSEHDSLKKDSHSRSSRNRNSSLKENNT